MNPSTIDLPHMGAIVSQAFFCGGIVAAIGLALSAIGVRR